MSKFRSKLKRKTKGKQWAHGQSATSNPQVNKHRMKARSRFFQPNLSLAPAPSSTAPLTLEAITKHDARQQFAGDGKTVADPTVNDIAMSLKSFNFNDDGASESQFGTFKTFQTFASNYSSCSNVSFNKFLNRFKQSSELHKEMLAILAAITEVIKDRNGTQSSTEYFLALLETLQATTQENEIIAAVSLLSIGIKRVPQPVLRKKFAECAPLLQKLFEQFVNSDTQNVLRAIISCISSVLRAQEYNDWSSPQTLKLFNQVLTFVIHTKPKLRKEAQHAVAAIIHGCCFMAPRKSVDGLNNIEDPLTNSAKITYHPAGTFVAKFCIEQFKPENLNKSETVVLHTLALLKDTLNGLKGADIKIVCEQLMSILAVSKVIVQTNCFHTLHSLFLSKSPNLTAERVYQLISAIHNYRPERTDVRQTLAWLTVLKQGYICLASFDAVLCVRELPRFIEVTATDVWMCDNSQIVSSASLVIKEVLLECVKPVCDVPQPDAATRKPIEKMLTYISRALTAPFGLVSQQVVLVYATVFEVTGQHFGAKLMEPLKAISQRYDEQDASRVQIEHTILAAIAGMGPEVVLTVIPLADSRNSVIISRSWLLPLLREAINRSTFEYFRTNILVLADQCQANWKKFKEAGDLPVAHTFELLYCQLWGLLPGFCRNPRDMSRFGTIAKRLGDALESDKDVRAPVLDGLKELLNNADDECKQQLTRYAKNFLNRLLNIYVTKPTGSYENDIRASAMEVIREYLKIAPQDTLYELFANAKGKFKSMEKMQAILEKIKELAAKVKQNEEARPIDASRQKEIQEAFDLIQSLVRGENTAGIDYIEENSDEVKEYLRLIPRKRLQNLFKLAHQNLGPFGYEAYFDIIESLAVFQSADNLKNLHTDYIVPTIRNVKKGGVTRLIKERQLKAYTLLRDILSSENEGCVLFVKGFVKRIQKLLLEAVHTKKHSSQIVRLTCLQILLDKQSDTITIDDELIKKSIPEALVAFHQAITKKRENIALKLLLKIGELHEKADKLNDFVDMLMAGFGGESVLIANTINMLRILVQQFTGGLTISTLTFILEQVLAFMVSRSRPEAEAAVNFLLVFVKILPSPYVANHLTEIVRSLSAMAPDTKRYCRLNVGYVWKRLCKRFTAEEIIKLVPGNDENTHKKLKNIRKELSRLKRQKLENSKDDSDEDGDDGDEDDDDLKKKSYTIDDILADSDSELEDDITMDADERSGDGKRNKKRKDDQKYIQEDADEIVDLADINAMSKITSSKPVRGGNSDVVKKPKDKNRGFRTADDGRLIIEEPKRGSKVESDSSDDEEDAADADALGEKPRRTIDDSDSEDDDMPKLAATARKRKAGDSLSMASGKTGASSRYTAGGKGIHRPLGAASVRSGRSMASTHAASTAYGSEYRAKKGKGDVKKKGQKMDPYAYIPLNRTSLNKRKQAKNASQFKGIVDGARKGAAAGSRNNKKRKL